MDDQEWLDRINRRLAETKDHPKTCWWLSFADADLPPGRQFLGVAVVRAQDLSWASIEAHRLGINPGGEVQAYRLPDDLERFIPPRFFNRLLTRAECAEFDREVEAARREAAS